MSGRGSGEGTPSGDDGGDLRARSKRLAESIEARRGADNAARARRMANQGSSSQAGSAYNLGMRMLAELVAGVLVGLVIGYGLDHWLGTRPLMMIVFIFFGTAAAVLNVMRAASGPRR